MCPSQKLFCVPVIAVTAGDPCGIGPEVILKNLAHGSLRRVRLVIIGDLAVFEQTAKRLHRRLPPWRVVAGRVSFRPAPAPISFVDCAHRATFHPGRSGAAAGRASLDYLETAVTLWRRGWVQALVTAPVTKWAITRTHPRFVGQTEYLSNAARATSPVMMFVAERLRIVLLTRHVALRDVPSRATSSLIRATLRVTAEGLRDYFGIRRPRIAICGLNPHGGERGAFGDEEQRILAPARRALGTDRARFEGPFAADGFFANLRGPARRRVGGGYDAVVCWYHDQGLIPFKMVARDIGCQLTLGLPFVRTSPDHGSALDIAGRGRANPGSMRYALDLAATLAKSGTQTNF